MHCYSLSLLFIVLSTSPTTLNNHTVLYNLMSLLPLSKLQPLSKLSRLNHQPRPVQYRETEGLIEAITNRLSELPLPPIAHCQSSVSLLLRYTMWLHMWLTCSIKGNSFSHEGMKASFSVFFFSFHSCLSLLLSVSDRKSDSCPKTGAWHVYLRQCIVF